MIEEYAVVERIHESGMDVRITKPEQCDTCAVRENCYSSGNVLTVPRESGIQEADQVRVTITNTSVLGLSALVYGVPLVAVLVGIILGYAVFFVSLGETGRTLGSLGLGIVLLAAAVFVVKHLGSRIAKNIKYATERIGASGSPDEQS